MIRRLRNFLWALLLSLCLPAVAEGVAPINEPGPNLLTGARVWTLADGAKRRLRFLGFENRQNSVRFANNIKTFIRPISVFAKEEQEVFKAFRSGKNRLVRTPGLNIEPDFKIHPKRRHNWLDVHWIGQRRNWTHHNGRIVEAALINLTDEHVSLLLDDSIWRQPLRDLEKDDLDYIAKIRRSEVPLFPARVPLTGSISWDGSGHSHEVYVKGERLAELPDPASRYEIVLAAAITHAKSKYAGDKLELLSFEEFPVGATSNRSRAASLAAPSPPKPPLPKLYRATFAAPMSARSEVARHWPATTSPSSWPTLEFYVYMLADGEIAQVDRVH